MTIFCYAEKTCVALIALISVSSCAHRAEQSSSGADQTVSGARPAIFTRAEDGDDVVTATYYNVGNGMCQVVDCPGTENRSFLVDCGTSSSIDAAALTGKVTARLNHRKINVIISHPDKDHHSLLPLILTSSSGLNVEAIWYGGMLSEYAPATQELITRTRGADKALVNGGAADDLAPFGDPEDEVRGYHTAITPGAPLLLNQCVPKKPGDSHVTEILAANTQMAGSGPGSKNTRSIVLRIRFGGVDFIFPGDATRLTEQYAVKNYPEALKNTVLAASHHGAETAGSNSPFWAKHLSPSIVIYNAGANATNRHPRCSILDRYAEENDQLKTAMEHDLNCGVNGATPFQSRTLSTAQYKTSDQGDITIKASVDQIVSVDCTTPGEGGGCGLLSPD